MFRLRHVPAGVVGAFSLVFSGLAHAQVAETTDEEGVKLRFQGGVNAVVERNLFWRFAETVAQAEDFTSDTEWLEAYVKPGLSYQRTTDSGATLYGGLSVVGSTLTGPVLPWQPPILLGHTTKNLSVSSALPGPTISFHQPSVGWPALALPTK